jgi:hypothetical protein
MYLDTDLYKLNEAMNNDDDWTNLLSLVENIEDNLDRSNYEGINGLCKYYKEQFPAIYSLIFRRRILDPIQHAKGSLKTSPKDSFINNLFGYCCSAEISNDLVWKRTYDALIFLNDSIKRIGRLNKSIKICNVIMNCTAYSEIYDDDFKKLIFFRFINKRWDGINEIFDKHQHKIDFSGSDLVIFLIYRESIDLDLSNTDWMNEYLKECPTNFVQFLSEKVWEMKSDLSPENGLGDEKWIYKKLQSMKSSFSLMLTHEKKLALDFAFAPDGWRNVTKPEGKFDLECHLTDWNFIYEYFSSSSDENCDNSQESKICISFSEKTEQVLLKIACNVNYLASSIIRAEQKPLRDGNNDNLDLILNMAEQCPQDFTDEMLNFVNCYFDLYIMSKDRYYKPNCYYCFNTLDIVSMAYILKEIYAERMSAELLQKLMPSSTISKGEKEEYLLRFFASGLNKNIVQFYNHPNPPDSCSPSECLKKIESNDCLVNQIVSSEILCEHLMNNSQAVLPGDYTYLDIGFIKAIERFIKEELVQNYTSEIFLTDSSSGTIKPDLKHDSSYITSVDKSGKKIQESVCKGQVSFPGTNKSDLSAESLSQKRGFECGTSYFALEYIFLVLHPNEAKYSYANPLFNLERPQNKTNNLENDFYHQWISKVRNGYLHIEPITNLKDAKDIREKTAYWFMYLILHLLPLQQ